MKSILLFVSVFLLSNTAMRSETVSFTMSAEVERNTSIGLDKDFVANYIKDLQIYPKFFPNIVSVSKLNDKESEWLYRVEAPLATPYNLTFVLEDKSSGDTLLFESKDKTNDYLFCQGILSQPVEKQNQNSFPVQNFNDTRKSQRYSFFSGCAG